MFNDIFRKVYGEPMGKGKRSRANAEVERKIFEEKQEIYKKEQKKSRIIKAVVSLCIVAVGLAAVFGSIGYNSLSKNGSFMRGKSVVSSKDFKINACMAQYLYNSSIKNFAESNASSLSQLKLDTTEDLSQQVCAYDKEISWHDYFVNNTKTQLEEIVVMAQAAKNEGMELQKTDINYIEESMKMFESLAEEDGLTAEEYVDENYGTEVSLKDIRECIETTQLASNYKTKYDESLSYTEKEIEGYWGENKNTFYTCDYMCFVVNTGATGKESAAELELLKKEAKKQAQELCKANNYTDFKTNLTKYFEKALKAADSTLSEEEIKNNVDSLIQNSSITGEGYDVTNDAGEWLFSSDRKSGDTTVIEVEDGYAAYCMVNPATKDSSETKNVRHILLSNENFEDDSECKQEANRLLKEWRNGEKTEESFAALAKEFSDDPGSSQLGGLYENVAEGVMVEAFNDWIFAQSRKAGDVDIVKTDYGYHVMYFVGDGYKAWQSDVVSAMKTDDYGKKLEELKKEFSPKVSDNNFKKIHQVKSEKSTSSN